MKKLGLKTVPVLLVALGLLGSCAPAFAGGHWNVTYESSGDCYGNDYYCWFNHGETHYDGDVLSHPWIDGNPINHNVFIDGDSNEDYGYDPLMAHIGGSVTAVFSWVPDSNTPNEPPPTKLSVVEQLLMNTPDQYTNPTHNTTVKGYQGKGLAQISNSARNSVIRLPVRNLNIDAYSAYQWDGLSFNLYLNYLAYPDTRSLKLTRGGRYEYSQLEGDEWHTYGDSIYSAHTDTYLFDDDVNHISIGAGYDGGWSTNVTPTWQSDGLDNVSSDSQALTGNAIFGSPVVHYPLTGSRFYSGNFTGMSTHSISLTAVDNADQARATAYYHLTLHDPIEDVRDDSYSYTVKKPYMYSDGRPIVGVGPRDDNSIDIEIKDETSIEIAASLKATADISLFKELLGLSAEASYTSTKTLTTTSSTHIPKDIPSGYYKYLIALHTFVRVHKRFYMFDKDGEIRRMRYTDFNGNPLNTPYKIYHELIQDHFLSNDARWSDPILGPVDDQNLPSVPAPSVEGDYDFPSESGGSS